MGSFSDMCFSASIYSTWPAVWEYGQDWPDQGQYDSRLAFASSLTTGPWAYFFPTGEIDILEGVNDHGTDQATLHTTSGMCTHVRTPPFLRAHAYSVCLRRLHCRRHAYHDWHVYWRQL